MVFIYNVVCTLTSVIISSLDKFGQTNFRLSKFCHIHCRHRLVLFTWRVGGEQNMVPVFCKPRSCVNIQTGPFDYALAISFSAFS